jgi:phage terminase large subunit-like protein
MPGRICAGLYQQRPAPEDGDYFKKDNLIGYTREELEQEERGGGFVNYTTSDFAVSEERGSDRHAHIPAGMDSKGNLWILPDIFWKVAGPAESVKAMLDMIQRRNPLVSLAEKGHISKSLAPYIENQKREREIYGHIEEITPARAKDVRARTFQGMTEIHKIKFPKFASWWEKAEHELLTFPGGKNDDFVDAISQLCLYLGSMVAAQPSVRNSRYEVESSTPGLHFTMKQLKQMDRTSKAKNQPRYQGR